MRAVRACLADPVAAETRARWLLESMALAVQGALMRRHADAAAAEAFVSSRIGNSGGRALGALDSTAAALGALVQRARLET